MRGRSCEKSWEKNVRRQLSGSVRQLSLSSSFATESGKSSSVHALASALAAAAAAPLQLVAAQQQPYQREIPQYYQQVPQQQNYYNQQNACYPGYYQQAPSNQVSQNQPVIVSNSGTPFLASNNGGFNITSTNSGPGKTQLLAMKSRVSGKGTATVHEAHDLAAGMSYVLDGRNPGGWQVGTNQQLKHQKLSTGSVVNDAFVAGGSVITPVNLGGGFGGSVQIASTFPASAAANVPYIPPPQPHPLPPHPPLPPQFQAPPPSAEECAMARGAVQLVPLPSATSPQSSYPAPPAVGSAGATPGVMSSGPVAEVAPAFAGAAGEAMASAG